MPEKLEMLHKLGLIGMYFTFETKTTYEILTEKGEKVAELIEGIIGIIDSEEEYKVPNVYTYWREKQRND